MLICHLILNHCILINCYFLFYKAIPTVKMTMTTEMPEVLPKHGILYQEAAAGMALCKPKLLPLKSMTLEKLENMQKEAQNTLKDQDAKVKENYYCVFSNSVKQFSGRIFRALAFMAIYQSRRQSLSQAKLTWHYVR